MSLPLYTPSPRLAQQQELTRQSTLQRVSGETGAVWALPSWFGLGWRCISATRYSAQCLEAWLILNGLIPAIAPLSAVALLLCVVSVLELFVAYNRWNDCLMFVAMQQRAARSDGWGMAKAVFATSQPGCMALTPIEIALGWAHLALACTFYFLLPQTVFVLAWYFIRRMKAWHSQMEAQSAVSPHSPSPPSVSKTVSQRDPVVDQEDEEDESSERKSFCTVTSGDSAHKAGSDDATSFASS